MQQTSEGDRDTHTDICTKRQKHRDKNTERHRGRDWDRDVCETEGETGNGD